MSGRLAPGASERREERLTRPGVVSAVPRGLGVEREQVAPPELLPGAQRVHLGAPRKRDGSDVRCTGSSGVGFREEESVCMMGGEHIVCTKGGDPTDFELLIGEHLERNSFRNLRAQIRQVI